MKLALLKGNRFNAWHLQVFGRLPGVELTAFRADSEIQRHFEARDDHSVECAVERVRFDTQSHNPVVSIRQRVQERLSGRTPRILPFHKRLQGYDLIQTWELFTDWTREALAAKRAYSVPVAIMVWDTIPFHNETNDERRELVRQALDEADAFIVHTERSRRMLELEGVRPERIFLTPPGVDIERFSPGDAARTALDLDDNEFVILFVGWLLPRKGLDFLLMAFRLLIDDRLLTRFRFRLLVVGGGPGRDRIDKLVDRLRLNDRVTYAGSLPYDRMPAAYHSADLFVLPSIPTPDWQEQFGMALLEAMASGKPIVATHSGAIPEIAGDAARLCAPADFVALYEAIRALVLTEHRRASLGHAARKRATEHFALDKATTALSEIYDELVSGEGRASARPATG